MKITAWMMIAAFAVVYRLATAETVTCTPCETELTYTVDAYDCRFDHDTLKLVTYCAADSTLRYYRFYDETKELVREIRGQRLSTGLGIFLQLGNDDRVVARLRDHFVRIDLYTRDIKTTKALKWCRLEFATTDSLIRSDTDEIEVQDDY